MKIPQSSVCMSTSLINRAVYNVTSFVGNVAFRSLCLRSEKPHRFCMYLVSFCASSIFYRWPRHEQEVADCNIFCLCTCISAFNAPFFFFFCRTSLALRNTNQFRDRIQFLHFREFCASSPTELHMALCLGQSLLPEAVAAWNLGITNASRFGARNCGLDELQHVFICV